MKRRIANVCMARSDADDIATYWRGRGLRPRIYERQARAENISIPVWVVVIDTGAGG